MNKYIAAALAALALGTTGWAQAVEVRVEQAWARATAPGQQTAMADLVLTSDVDATLVGFSSPACNSPEMHGMVHEHGMMKMNRIESIPLPAGKAVKLSTQHVHMMLVGLKQALVAGEQLPLTLMIHSAAGDSRVEARAEILPLTAPAPMAQDAHHGMHH